MIEFKDQELHVSGKIDYDNAQAYYLKGLEYVQKYSSAPITVNLEKLDSGSTVALAVLVRWLRQTPKAQGLAFKSVPEKMMKIIQACHLEHDLKII
ncbi:toluene tolerance protein [Acinetobacter sp. NCu2D-2]|uniref:STAS domain-containing protein n=1 Tax=Acinetobacter sp. NCu2D-2 TaxID=1608473 RepID=UPI0007CDA574|nr:STAS domain-containing protein [Acinetobacter sp. NCu2D-2]ANF82603.1 toluene tolerance protein [Acinetobacter sp. NCu2D-2]